MSKQRVVDAILEHKIVAILRLDEEDKIVPVAEALIEGGIRCIEVTTNTPGAFDALPSVAELHDDVFVGMGTVLDADMARAAVDAGASFIITPITDVSIVEVAHEEGVPIGMGAYTPTEMYRAHRHGSDFVKVFPAKYLEPGYLRAVKAPLPDLRLMPTGGVGPDNARTWLAHGAEALGVGSALTPSHAIAEERYDDLTQRAATLIETISKE